MGVRKVTILCTGRRVRPVCTVYKGRGHSWCVLCTGGGVIPDVYCVQGEESYLMCTVYRGRGVTLDVSDMMCTVFRGRCQT